MGRRGWCRNGHTLAIAAALVVSAAGCAGNDRAADADETAGPVDETAGPVDDAGDEDGSEDETPSSADDGDPDGGPDRDDPEPTGTPADPTAEVARNREPEEEIDPDDLLAPVVPGDKGEEVIALQARLDELGFGPGPTDGSYGRRTEAAVAVFQELADLQPTGKADPRTMRALATYRYEGLMLAAGDEGDEVEELQERLAGGPFDPGPIDGQYGSATVAAVWALEKLAGVPIDGDWGPPDELAWQRLTSGQVGQPVENHDQRWVEVDLSEQLVKVYDPDRSTPVLIAHVSSGSGIPWSNEGHSGSSITPKGEFHISRRINGWRESSLGIGRLYNPLYFNGGIAFHGATSVPRYPASHGCVRVPMHIAEYLPDELPNGTPVHVMA